MFIGTENLGKKREKKKKFFIHCLKKITDNQGKIGEKGLQTN